MREWSEYNAYDEFKSIQAWDEIQQDIERLNRFSHQEQIAPEYPEWSELRGHKHTKFAGSFFCVLNNALFQWTEGSKEMSESHIVGPEILTSLPEFLLTERL